jgi:hypothetical protein
MPRYPSIVPTLPSKELPHLAGAAKRSLAERVAALTLSLHDGTDEVLRATKSSRRPLKTGARSNLPAVIALYSTSAGTTSSTQVAFGFLIGTESGEVLRMYGSRRSRSSYSISWLYPVCAFPSTANACKQARSSLCSTSPAPLQGLP